MELILFLIPAFIHGWLMGDFSLSKTDEEIAVKPLEDGVKLFKDGKVAEAFRYFESHRDILVKSAYLHLYVGKCHFHFENWEAALSAFEKSIRLDTTLREAYYYQDRCLYNSEDWENAGRELKRASRIHLDRNPELLKLLANVDYRLGNFENADKNLRIAFDLEAQGF